MTEYLKLIGIFLGVIVVYIASGTAVNVLVKGEAFDWKRMINGIVKAVIAAACIIVLAYASTIVEIEGFSPATFLKSGIAAYGAKLLANILELLKSTSTTENSNNNVVSTIAEKITSKITTTKTEDTDNNEDGTVG